MNLVELALSRGVQLCTAESLTAGRVCASIAAWPGASKVLLGGLIAYQDQVKSQLLGVSPGLIESQSAVDPEVAAQLALGAQAKFSKAAGANPTTTLAISTTGVAGPDSVGIHSVGTVYIGVAFGDRLSVYAEQFAGDREQITSSTIERCLELIREHLERT